MRTLVVTGTGTAVGKTVVVAALAAVARSRGEAVAVVKPVQTGPGPRDVDEVRRLSGVDDVHELAGFEEPLAPATAARRAGRAVPPIVAAVEALADRDLVLVEGAGGLLVRLDAEGTTIADVAAALGAPVVVVVRAGLGTLNATALTCEALRARSVECAGIVVGSWPQAPDLAARCNLEDLPEYAGAPLLGRLPDGAGELGRAAFLHVAQNALTTEARA
jgi:dethiobiotin synthetase